jgi:hypothetical protein
VILILTRPSLRHTSAYQRDTFKRFLQPNKAACITGFWSSACTNVGKICSRLQTRKAELQPSLIVAASMIFRISTDHSNGVLG